MSFRSNNFIHLPQSPRQARWFLVFLLFLLGVQNPSKPNDAGKSVQDKVFSVCLQVYAFCVRNFILDFPATSLTVERPVKKDVFTYEYYQRMKFTQAKWNDFPVVFGKSKEATYVVAIPWVEQFCNFIAVSTSKIMPL